MLKRLSPLAADQTNSCAAGIFLKYRSCGKNDKDQQG